MDSVSELHGEVDSIQTSLILLILPTAITECRLCLSAQHYEGFIKIRKIYHVGLKGFTRSPAEPRNWPPHPVAVQHKQCAKVLMPRTTTK